MAPVTSQMSFGQFEQESLLTIIAYDDSPGGCVVAIDLLPEEVFTTMHRWIYRDLKSFVDRFKTAPGTHFYDIIEDLMVRHENEAKFIRQTYDSMTVSWEEKKLNRDYVFSRARLFGRAQRLVTGCGEALKHLQQKLTDETCDAAELVITSSMRTNFDVMDLGTSTHDPKRFVRFVDRGQQQNTFHMGVKELDAEGLGPTRKELFMIGGAYGSGKSFGLLHVALATLFLSHQDVIFYSLEMTEERCCARVAAMLFSYATSARKEKFNRLIKDDEGRVIDFEPDFLRTECAFDKEGELLKKIEGLQHRPQLIIKSFPSNTFTMQRCEAHQDALLAKEGIQAGLVITDYSAIMQIKNPAHKRLEIGAHITESRRVAFERNQAHGNAMQLNRPGMTGQARGVHAAEDISVLHTADNAFIYNATESEKQLGLARIFVDKARNGKPSFEVLISQAYGAGKWKIGSSLMHSNYQKLLKGDEEDE